MMTRIQFLRSLAGLGVGVVGVAAVAGCSSDEDPTAVDAGGQPAVDAPGQPPIDAPGNPPVDAPPMACTSASGVIGSNHGHAITIPAADIEATTDRSYAIKGTSPHPHTVVITAAGFATLRASGTLVVTSSTDAGHAHSVTVTCA